MAKKQKNAWRLTRRHVFAGITAKTNTGLSKGSFVKNKAGKIVSKKRYIQGRFNLWMTALAAARLALNIKGFALVAKRSPLYKKTKQFHQQYLDEVTKYKEWVARTSGVVPVRGSMAPVLKWTQCLLPLEKQLRSMSLANNSIAD